MKNDPVRRTRGQRIWRQLLRLDADLEILTADEAKVAQEKNFLVNLFYNSFDVIFFMGGASLLSATTILPLFISKLSDSTIPLAIVAMLAQGSFFLPQLFTANYIEKLNFKKPVVVNLGFFTERIPALLLVVPPFIALRSPLAALIIFLLIYAWFGFGGGVIAPAWQDMVARCFPAERRGRFFGSTMFVGTLIGVGAASVASTVLDTIPFPRNFAIVFGAAGLSIFISWLFLMGVKEPIEAANVPDLSIGQYFAELPALVRADRNFRNFLGARFAITLTEMGGGFLTVAAIQRWSVSDGTVAAYTTATLIGQTTASLVMGFLADRYGHRLMLIISTAVSAITFLCAWLAPDPSWFFLVFFSLGFYTGARIVSGLLVVLEFCAPEKRPTYVGVTNTLAGVGSIIAPLIGASLVAIDFSWAFAGSFIASVISFFMLILWVKEPRFATAENS